MRPAEAAALAARTAPPATPGWRPRVQAGRVQHHPFRTPSPGWAPPTPRAPRHPCLYSWVRSPPSTCPRGRRSGLSGPWSPGGSDLRCPLVVAAGTRLSGRPQGSSSARWAPPLSSKHPRRDSSPHSRRCSRYSAPAPPLSPTRPLRAWGPETDVSHAQLPPPSVACFHGLSLPGRLSFCILPERTVSSRQKHQDPLLPSSSSVPTQSSPCRPRGSVSRLLPPPRGPHKGLQVPDRAEGPGVEKGPQSEGPTCSEAALPSPFLLVVSHISTNCPLHRYPYFQKLNCRKEYF